MFENEQIIFDEFIALSITPKNNGITQDIDTKEYKIPQKNIPEYPFFIGKFLILKFKLILMLNTIIKPNIISIIPTIRFN